MGSAAVLLLTARGLPRRGPALRRAAVPLGPAALSMAAHAALGVAVVLAASWWSANQPKTYIVNLVPSVAAVGRPQGQVSLPPRAEERPVSTPSPRELPQRERPRPAAPELPARRETPSLPERGLPPRAAGLSRAGEKELPTVTTAARREGPSPAATVPRGESGRPTEASLGRPSGSAQGTGAVTLNASDFPFAYYLRIVQTKIAERWEGKALPGNQPVAVFEIGRDGRVSGLAIEKKSGNPYYDQAALRAITEATPFPPLPPEFSGSLLRVHLGFNFAADRG